jgi:hypothetical protein
MIRHSLLYSCRQLGIFLCIILYFLCLFWGTNCFMGGPRLELAIFGAVEHGFALAACQICGFGAKLARLCFFILQVILHIFDK